MDAWVEDAIENGTEYPEEMVMQLDRRGKDSIEDDIDGNWPDNQYSV